MGNFSEAGADLELRGVTKRFPGFTAIESLDLTIPAGSFFARLMSPAIGKQNASNVKKQDFNR